MAVRWEFRADRSLLVTRATLPSAGFDAWALVVTFAPGKTLKPDGTVTPGPTRARAETIAPGLMVALSIRAPGPISVGLAAMPYAPIVLGPRICAP